MCIGDLADIMQGVPKEGLTYCPFRHAQPQLQLQLQLGAEMAIVTAQF